MAVNFYRSAANPSAAQFTLRGLFACCYGGGLQKKDESPLEEKKTFKIKGTDENPYASDSSDEEIRQNFVRARESSFSRSVTRKETSASQDFENEHPTASQNGESRLSSEPELSTPSEKKVRYGKETSALMEEQFAKYGILNASFAYDYKKSKLCVSVNQVQDIPNTKKNSPGSYQVRLTLLPQKRVRYKTKIRSGESPFFEEMFQFSKILPEDVGELAIRFRLYNVERLRRERAVSETVFNLSALDLQEEKAYNLILASSAALKSGYGTSESQLDLSSDGASLSASMASSSNIPVGDPELLLGLTYNGTTGRLAVEVMKGSSLRAPGTNKPPDSFVTVVLMSANGQTLAHSKTSVRKGQPNPLFRETFMFQIAQFQLTDISLMVNVYNKKAMSRKEMIGWVCIGLNSSGEEEMLHWEDMKQAHGEQVARWHILQESSI